MLKKLTETREGEFHGILPIAVLLKPPPDFVLAGPPSMIGVIIFDSSGLICVTESTTIKYGYEREALNAAKDIFSGNGRLSEIDAVSDDGLVNLQLETIQTAFQEL